MFNAGRSQGSVQHRPSPLQLQLTQRQRPPPGSGSRYVRFGVDDRSDTAVYCMEWDHMSFLQRTAITSHYLTSTLRPHAVAAAARPRPAAGACYSSTQKTHSLMPPANAASMPPLTYHSFSPPPLSPTQEQLDFCACWEGVAHWRAWRGQA